jgi:hypothetical protein
VKRLAALAAVMLVAGGCGGGSSSSSSTGAAPAAKRAIPHSLRAVASGAQDTAKLVLAGDRARAVTAANALNRAAQGDAAKDLADAGVPATQIDDLKERAAAVAGIAARGKPIDVALAANRAFELVPDLFAFYADRVPSLVTSLDYLESEARLQALAGDRARVADAVNGLTVVWTELRKKVVRRAGGETPAAAFDAHARALRRLVRSDAATRTLAGEAQHGVELVAEIRAVYAG